MKAIVQRVVGATRIVHEAEGPVVDEQFTGPGLVVLLGWESADESRADLATAEEWIVSRVAGLRVFPDAAGRMNLSLSDYLTANAEVGGGGILWVPQFTLAAKLDSGFRPSFTMAMKPDLARARFGELMKTVPPLPGVVHLFGSFGANMQLTFTNWGPVTIPLSV